MLSRGLRSEAQERLLDLLAKFGKPDSENLALFDDESLGELLLRAESGGLGMAVLNGDPVAKGELVECVAVGSGSEWGASGVLISPNVALTATHSFILGHCARIWVGEVTDDPTRGHEISVAAGEALGTCSVTRCEKDVAVLVLSEKVQNVAFPKLAQSHTYDVADQALVVGFGETDTSGSSGSGRKRKGEVGPIRGTVRRYDGGLVDYDAKEELVCRSLLLEKPQDACSKDSGGPLYLRESSDWCLAGITGRSAGLSMSPCGGGAVYARLDAHLAQIDTVIERLGGEPRQAV
jgi:hypothetical protein